MDTIFTAIGVILLKTQPLLGFLGLGSAAIAVQITVLAAITLISIAVSIGIVALIGYSLKKLIKKMHLYLKTKKTLYQNQKMMSRN